MVRVQFGSPRPAPMVAPVRKAPLSWRAAKAVWKGTPRVCRWSRAHWRGLAPIHAALLLLLAGAALGVMPEGGRTASVLALLAGGVVRLYVWRRCQAGRPLKDRKLLYVTAAYVSATLWLVTAGAIGAGPPMPGILLLLTVGFGVPWWWHHRIRGHVPADQRTAVWDQRVACSGGVLPGWQLTSIEAVPSGWAATVQLPPGRLHTDAAVAATARIASAYSVAATAVVIEPPDTGVQDQARLLVLEDNPLQAVQRFVAPSLDRESGWITVGRHADGTPARWRLYIPGSGACHGVIAGTTGAGKSGLTALLCTEGRPSGLAVLWLADPEEGESVPDWTDAAGRFAGTIPEIRGMLQAAERVMDGRKHRRAGERWTDELGRRRKGRGRFTPTPEVPQLVVVIDEAPDVLADAECARVVARIGKKGRKVGVSCLLDVQVPSVAELGGDLTIRSMLSSTNVAMFRTSDKLSRQMGMPSDLPADPASLPVSWPDGSSTAGLGYLAAAGGRVSPMRAYHVTDPYRWATTGAPVPLDAASVADADEHKAEVYELVRPSTKDDVLAYVRDQGEPCRTGVIQQRLGVPMSTVTTTLTRLAEAGEVRKTNRGEWIAAENELVAV